MPYFPFYQRLRCAVLMALSGGAVAQAMSLWGGGLARHLPPLTLLICAACAGAGLAGVLLADAFGRRGWAGAICATLAWPLATAVGAVSGASLLCLVTGPVSGAGEALEAGTRLGLLAVTDGITSNPVVAVIWALSGAATHHGAMAERA